MTNISTEKVIQYDVYEPYNYTKLNLSLCENNSIEIYIPFQLTDELKELYESLKEQGYDLSDIFDINSPFYSDICTPFTTPDGTDIILLDRKTYIFNTINLCQSNCQFSGYSEETELVKCVVMLVIPLLMKK